MPREIVDEIRKLIFGMDKHASVEGALGQLSFTGLPMPRDYILAALIFSNRFYGEDPDYAFSELTLALEAYREYYIDRNKWMEQSDDQVCI